MRKKALLKVLGLLGAVAMVTGFSVLLVTTVPVRIVGPFFTTPIAFDSATGQQIGGQVQYYIASDSVRIGQLVYHSGHNTVAASATLANYNKIAGVVIGGTRQGMQASIAVADTSTLAATNGQRAIVLVRGRFWVLDSAGGDGPGIVLRPSGTAGRAAAALAAIDSNSRNFGRVIDTIIGGKTGLVQINVK
jgi:hypothetical protein